MVESVADLVFRIVVVLMILAGWLWIFAGWVMQRLRERRQAAAATKDPGSPSAAS